MDAAGSGDCGCDWLETDGAETSDGPEEEVTPGDDWQAVKAARHTSSRQAVIQERKERILSHLIKILEKKKPSAPETWDERLTFRGTTRIRVKKRALELR